MAVQLDSEVSVEVHTAPPVRNKFLIGAGDIEVGENGVIVGNEVAGSFTELMLPPGMIHVAVYGNSANDQEIDSIDFLVTSA